MKAEGSWRAAPKSQAGSTTTLSHRYPDALCATNISDIVWILTISDIFATLIEDRRYKPPMPRDKGYEIICSMRGKLEALLLAVLRKSH
jgi:HD-GYP domain-containing protein (c-di-GMP phosphodiesterase class II)